MTEDDDDTEQRNRAFKAPEEAAYHVKIGVNRGQYYVRIPKEVSIKMGINRDSLIRIIIKTNEDKPCMILEVVE